MKIRNYKRNQKEILEFKKSGNQIKNLLEGVNRRWKLGEQISKHEDRLTDAIQSESRRK